MHETRRALRTLEESTDDKERKPGREETFGGVAFSHPIVHQIGGETDTNRNVTQRILLLSESMPIGRPDAYSRVLGAAINRYVRDDRGLLYGSSDHRIPRFLLNDIVRYWRTVAVDFAYKQHARGVRGMALRNIKLRLSRKLVFTSGLLRCFLCSDAALQEELAVGVEEGASAVSLVLSAWCRHSPLEVLADAVQFFTVADDVASELFSAYDNFIEFIDDERRRTELNELEGFEGPLFEEGRKIGRRFDEALKRMFFDGTQGPGTLASLTRKYGVF